MQKAFGVPALGVCIDPARLTSRSLLLCHPERPKQFRDGEEEVPFREMDPRADSSSGSVAVVVALFRVGARDILGCEERTTGVALRVENVGVRMSFGVVVQTPDIKYDGATFRDFHAIECIV